MPTGERGGVTQRQPMKRRTTLLAALGTPQPSPATSENSRGAGKASTSRQPRTTLPASSYGAIMAREQKPLRPSDDIGMPPATVKELRRINAKNPLALGKLEMQTVLDLATAVRDTPRGVAQLVKSEGLDLRDAGNALRKGDLHPPGGFIPRTKTLGTTIAKQTRDDLRHPSRHPGNFLLDVILPARAAATASARLALLPEDLTRIRTLRAAAAGKPRRATSGAATAKKIGRFYVDSYAKIGRAVARQPKDHPRELLYGLGRRGVQIERQRVAGDARR